MLRRAADLIEADGIQAMDILDVTISQAIIAEGPLVSVTVYWSPGTEQPPTLRGHDGLGVAVRYEALVEDDLQLGCES